MRKVRLTDCDGCVLEFERSGNDFLVRAEDNEREDARMIMILINQKQIELLGSLLTSSSAESVTLDDEGKLTENFGEEV